MDLLTGSSEHETEKAKWEQPHRRFLEFPKMLYQGGIDDAGKVGIRTWIVADEDAERSAKRDGWENSPVDARLAYDLQQDAIAQAAAEAAGRVRAMSDKAQREYTDVERGDEDHVTDVTSKSVAKRLAAQKG